MYIIGRHALLIIDRIINNINGRTTVKIKINLSLKVKTINLPLNLLTILKENKDFNGRLTPLL